jgi:hypothetical protein
VEGIAPSMPRGNAGHGSDSALPSSQPQLTPVDCRQALRLPWNLEKKTARRAVSHPARERRTARFFPRLLGSRRRLRPLAARAVAEVGKTDVKSDLDDMMRLNQPDISHARDAGTGGEASSSRSRWGSVIPFTGIDRIYI